MITRSYDASRMEKALDLVDNPSNKELDYAAWVANPNNVMLIEGDDVGIGTFEYPGAYTIHWFFQSRGRAALNQAKAMLAMFFETVDCKLARGLTPVDLRGARWLARQIGMTSQGILDFDTGPHELFTITNEDFQRRNNLNG